MWRATRSAGGRQRRRTPRGRGRTAPACGVRSLRARRARLASRRHGRGLPDPRHGPPDLLGHVEPPARPVHREILPEVGELQRGAHRIRRVVERVGPIAAQAKHDAADRIRRTATVVEHVVPGRVARDDDVLLECAQQIGEERLGQLELLDGVEQGGKIVPGAGSGVGSRSVHGARGPGSGAPGRRAGAGARSSPVPVRRRCRRRCGRRHRPPPRAVEGGWEAGERRPGSSRSACAPAARTPRTMPGDSRDRGESHHCVSLTPARRFAARAMVNSRSETRFR